MHHKDGPQPLWWLSWKNLSRAREPFSFPSVYSVMRHVRVLILLIPCCMLMVLITLNLWSEETDYKKLNQMGYKLSSDTSSCGTCLVVYFFPFACWLILLLTRLVCSHSYLFHMARYYLGHVTASLHLLLLQCAADAEPQTCLFGL